MNTHPINNPTMKEQSLCNENWQRVTSRVQEACKKAGRLRTSVHVVGITKYVDISRTLAIYNAGCRALGESRPQAFWDKAAVFASGGIQVQWHLIGHLQRNKVAKTMSYSPVIQTIDSVRLAKEVSRVTASSSTVCEGFIEVNLSQQSERSGVVLESLTDVVAQILVLPGIRICGLMGMASHPKTGREPRREFAHLRELRDVLNEKFPEAGGLPELSMGMSGDFEEAILEGSTMVRIGSALFDGFD